MAEEKYVPRLKTKYNNEVKQQLQDKFQYENVMMIPKFEKIVVNMGVGEAATDSKAIDGAVRDLRAITGQQPMITRARKSIATFRLRAGMPIGCKVTLRGDRMWEFFDRLTSVAIPRIRDFRGISAKSFDGRGNFSMGVTEQLIFPVVDVMQQRLQKPPRLGVGEQVDRCAQIPENLDIWQHPLVPLFPRQPFRLSTVLRCFEFSDLL